MHYTTSKTLKLHGIKTFSSMRTSSVLTALVAAANAQDSYYNITSKPFQLVLYSPDGSYKDTLSACHTGAALESLCLSNSNTTSKPDPTPYSTFNFNTSIYIQPPADASLGVLGIVTWILPALPPIHSSLNFFFDSTTDLTLPIIEPGSSNHLFAFDSSDEMTVQGYVHWDTNPPTPGPTYGLKRWYACKTYYSGYQYENLAWAMGPREPENPTCEKVTVKRVFV
jgi:hypothetical protein